MAVEQLAARISRNPQSPLFARFAEEQLRARKVDQALLVCEKGIQLFPQYTTAHIVAALCYLEKSEFQSALRHLELAINRLPDNRVLLKLRDDWLERSKAQQGKQPQKPDGSRPTEVAGKPVAAEGIAPETDTSSRSRGVSSDERSLEEAPIVSVTLAEIYVMQGAYEAAIAMYRRLQQQKPQRAKQFEEKIRELKEKIRQRS